MGSNVGGEERHVVEGSAGLGEACGGLDIVRAAVRDSLAHGNLLVIGEQAGFDDDLQKLSLAGALHRGDFGGDVVPFGFLGPADVDDHVHLIGSVVHGVGGHEALGGGGVVAVGEADDGADGQFVPHIGFRLLDKGGGDADGGGVVLHAVVADTPDVRPGGGLGQQSVVALGENFTQFHNVKSFLLMNSINLLPGISAWALFLPHRLPFWPWRRMTRFSRIPRT